MVNERLIKQRREEALEIRKKLWWALPFFIGLAIFCWWGAKSVYLDFLGLLALDPTVRLMPLILLLGPLVILMCVEIFTLHILKAVPYHGIWLRRLISLTTTTVLAMFGFMVTVPFVSPLVQNHYMPKLGYSKCLLLEGGRFSLWSTDWVKNPDWCVKGKTREWVNEQAALQAPKAQAAP